MQKEISIFNFPQFGYYENNQFIKADQKPIIHDLAWVANYIRTNVKARHATTTLRTLPNADVTIRRLKKIDNKFVDYDVTMSKRKAYKQTQFMQCCFGGVFKGGHKAVNLVQPSNLFVLDFDHIGGADEIAQAFNKLIADTQVQPLLLFVSPSGDGLKMVFNIEYSTDKPTWEKRLQAVWHYMRTTYQLDADTANKDVCRGCYLPYDENVYFNPSAQTTLDFDQWQPPQPMQPQSKQHTEWVNNGDATDAARAMWCAVELEHRGIDITGNQTTWATLGMAIAELGEQGREIFHTISRAGYANYDYYETDELYNYCMSNRRGTISIASFFNVANAALGTTYEKEHKNEYKQTYSAMNTPTTAAATPQPQQAAPSADQQTAEQQQTEKLKQVLFADVTVEKVFQECGTVPPSIPTPFEFGCGDDAEKLTLPRMALTIIAAQTSGGKTRMLENLAMYVANYTDEQTQGETLFFSLEETKTDVIAEFVNIYSNEPFTKNGLPTKNLDAIKSVFRCNQGFGTYAETNTQETRKEFGQIRNAIENYVSSYLMPQNGEKAPKMRLYDDEMFCDVHLLDAALRMFAKEHPIKAVFVDYLGMFRSPMHELKLPKTERIERTLDVLEQVAKDLRIPIVISAQLKREKGVTPFGLQNQSVADSADIERSCNTMVLLANSREPFDVSAEEKQALAQGGFVCGQGGKLFARITKRRGGVRGGAVILDFNENTGKIKQGTPIQHPSTFRADMMQTDDKLTYKENKNDTLPF